MLRGPEMIISLNGNLILLHASINFTKSYIHNDLSSKFKQRYQHRAFSVFHRPMAYDLR
jgi:hypothetical protein